MEGNDWSTRQVGKKCSLEKRCLPEPLEARGWLAAMLDLASTQKKNGVRNPNPAECFQPKF